MNLKNTLIAIQISKSRQYSVKFRSMERKLTEVIMNKEWKTGMFDSSVFRSDNGSTKSKGKNIQFLEMYYNI